MRYKIDPAIRREIAEKIVMECTPGYMRDYMGTHYVLSRDGKTFDLVAHKAANAPWNPWADNVTAYPIYALYEDLGGFNPEVDAFATEYYAENHPAMTDEEVAEKVLQDTIDFALYELPQEWISDSFDHDSEGW